MTLFSKSPCFFYLWPKHSVVVNLTEVSLFFCFLKTCIYFFPQKYFPIYIFFTKAFDWWCKKYEEIKSPWLVFKGANDPQHKHTLNKPLMNLCRCLKYHHVNIHPSRALDFCIWTLTGVKVTFINSQEQNLFCFFMEGGNFRLLFETWRSLYAEFMF